MTPAIAQNTLTASTTRTAPPIAPVAPQQPANGKACAYPLVSRAANPSGTIVRVGSAEFGGDRIVVIAGPCAIESREQLLETAHWVKVAGASVLRGGAYKPRTSPYDFQGLGEQGLEMLAEAGDIVGLPTITEVTDTEDVEIISRYVDILQIGSRNMSAFRLLRKAAATGKPILLKRGFQATIREWLLSAEYILAQGNSKLILCERGIRTHDSEFTRNTLDLNAVPLLATETHLPVIVDPSHGTGRSDLVSVMARGAIAVGASGLMIEVHRNPEEALCDGKQSLSTGEFASLMTSLSPFAALLGRSV